MTISDWLENANKQLRKAGVTSARLDAELLLSYALKKPREYLLAHPEIEFKNQLLRGQSSKELGELLQRRVAREPLAYILGEKEFYGRMFRVDENVLVPRPETEEMIDALKRIVAYEIRNKKYGELQIIDIGTGSGCLAITAKLELSDARVIATDTSKKALETARKNARRHQAGVEFIRGSLLQPLPYSIFHTPYFILLANLPYVPIDYPINDDARHEPAEALFSGVDGLDLYRQLFDQTDHLAHKPEFIFTEAMPTQHKTLVNIASTHGYPLEQTSGFIQVFKANLK